MLEAGFSSYAVGWWMARDAPALVKINKLLDLAVELGYSRLQVACNCPLHELKQEELSAFAESVRARGICLEVGARRLTRDALESYLVIAQFLDSHLLRFVVDGEGYEPDCDEVFAVVREALPILREMRVILAIENHDRFGADALRNMVEKWDSPWVGVCLDTANSFGCGEDVRTLVKALAPMVVSLHVKDVLARRLPHMQGFIIEGVPLGEGVIPVEWLLERFSAEPRCRSVVLEHWVPPEIDLAATIAKERVWCHQSTQVLRSLLVDRDEVIRSH